MKPHQFFAALAAALLLTGGRAVAQAQEICVTRYVGGELVTICFGGGGEEPPPGSCVPGTHVEIRTRPVEGWPGMCYLEAVVVDNCTGEQVGGWSGGVGYCQLPGPPAPAEHPCTIFQVGPGGITCGTEWLVSASVGYPETFLDLSPYPASLVRWPTAARCSALPPSTGSGSMA
jgi:hypothetical protein